MNVMTPTTTDINNQWNEAFSRLPEQHPSVKARRAEAMAAFNSLGLPTNKHEEWKYSNPKRIATTSYTFQADSQLTAAEIEQFPVPNLTGHILYFVNGRFRPELSTDTAIEDGLQILSFQEALATQPDIIDKYWGKELIQTDAFTELNTALANEGVVIIVKPNATITHPVIIRNIADVQHENVSTQIRNLVVVGENAEVKVAEAYRTLGTKQAFSNVITEIYVAKSARVDYYKVQNESDASAHVGTTTVHQEDNSYFYAATFTINGGFVRNNLHLLLDGQHIDSHMYGLYLPNERQHIDNHTVVDHRKPNSVSTELYKGILNDKATGVFNGKIFVQQDAQKTNAYQNCRNVLLSGTASMNTKPQLEIWADDVKCSHGTTTGQLDDDAIFYMQSRGIPRKEAIRLQLLAFAEDVVDKIKIESLQHYLEQLIKEKLSA